MVNEQQTKVRLEIAHVLFIDIVGYSKLSIDDQRRAIERLNDAVQSTAAFQQAEAAARLAKFSTGDGMALVFYDSPESPVECAMEISRKLSAPDAPSLRMGIHSGPVSGVVDVSGRGNVAGEGINIAQRVMDCGDAGHILLSNRLAQDLSQFKHWRPHLHDLGECEVKHGVSVGLVNLFTSEIGNSDRPTKVERAAPAMGAREVVSSERKTSRWLWFAPAALVLLALVVILFLRGRPSVKPVSSSSNIPDKSIAVLPFENLSRDPDNAFFTDGVQDEILTDLAKIADLKVISRTSVMQYKAGIVRNLREIGEQLGVAHVLEGSVQRVANRVRVNAQLLDARNDAHLWAETYDRELADVFAIQTEIAKTIAEQLQAKLSPREKAVLGSKPTQDTEAYDLYLRAKELMHGTSAMESGLPEIYPKAVALLEKAIARDPNFAFAYCLLAEANLSLYWMGESVLGSRERGEIAVEAARRLAPQAGETYLAEALFFYWGNRDYDHALHSLQEAARLLPNNVDVLRYSAWIERRLGRWQDCIRHEEKAADLAPRDWHPRDDLIQSYELVRDYPAALRIAARAISEFPQKADYFRTQKAGMELYAGDLKSARATLNTLSDQNQFIWQLYYLAVLERNYDEAFRLLKMWSDRHEPDNAQFPRSFLEGLAARAAGQADRARTAFLAAQQHFSNLLADRKEQQYFISQLAIVHAGLGRKEEAFQEARHAVELLPMSRDTVSGTQMVRNLALVYCWTGETDHAIEQLSLVTTRPSDVSYGELKFDPGWDPLRGDPRFEKIVASLAPKEPNK